MSAHPVRFHALDATRAFALLLGVVFHAAWFYMPYPARTAVTDVGANDFFGWFFVVSHTFRMQLFFLIAGFFARLVVEKRGVGVFVRNRLKRILAPLVVCWFLLIPLFYGVWIWGFSLSGQADPETPAFMAGLFMLASGRVFVERASGGAFVLVHLWFLYYLLWTYVVALVVRPLWRRISGAVANRRVDGAVGWVARSGWGPLVLAVLLVPAMAAMPDFKGVATPTESLVPLWAPLLVYLGFFGFGWLLHRQADRLMGFFRGWRVHLVLGLILSVPLYLGTKKMVLEKDQGAKYPMVVYADVEDWGEFRGSLVALEGSGAVEAERLWAKLPPWLRANLGAGRELSKDERSGLLKELGMLLALEDLFTVDAPEEVREGPPPMVKPELPVVLANREVLDGLVEGVTGDVASKQDWFWPVKVGFALGYSLTTCLLVFGSLGFFQRFCGGHSPAWRYLADSSYWVYLLHIPVVPALEILIFRWELTVWVKFPLLMAVSFLLLYLSYHLLVRSTFIGKVLNGRRYPFHWNPMRSVAGDKG